MSVGRFTPPRPIHLLFQSNFNNIAYYEALFRVSVSLRHRLHLHKHGTPVYASFCRSDAAAVRHTPPYQLRYAAHHISPRPGHGQRDCAYSDDLHRGDMLIVHNGGIPYAPFADTATGGHGDSRVPYTLNVLMPDTNIYTISSTQPGYLPLMFIGIYLFLALAGPGKISLDYFISLYIVSTRGKDDTQTEELEEV